MEHIYKNDINHNSKNALKVRHIKPHKDVN